jgi:hypothetical protein
MSDMDRIIAAKPKTERELRDRISRLDSTSSTRSDTNHVMDSFFRPSRYLYNEVMNMADTSNSDTKNRLYDQYFGIK